MANAYTELKTRQQKEFNDFPLAFAFDEQQLTKGLAQLGLEPHDRQKITMIGAGGFIRKTDLDSYHHMNKRHEEEFLSAISGDHTGDGFILDMFTYELANHEYGITYDSIDTLDALGLSAEEVQNDERLMNALRKAKEIVIEETEM